MVLDKLIFRSHAVTRMFERNISVADVRNVLENGKVIKDYADDKPFASQLIIGWIADRPLHIVFAKDVENSTIIIVTVYEPDPSIWQENFERKK